MSRKVGAVSFASILLTALPASAQTPNVPDCSQKFLALWLWSRDEAIKQLPKRPCRLYGETGQYICDKGGCRRS
jgi:hypothetical protein